MKRCLLPVFLCLAIVCGCSSGEAKRQSIEILDSRGKPAKEYSSSQEVIADSNVGEENGMPNYINGEDTAVTAEKPNSPSGNYCGNKNSKVFHLVSCSSAKKTKEENKIYLGSREEFISKGYKPCSRCNP